MLKQITLLSICLAASTAFANSDSTMVPYNSVAESEVTEIFKSIADSSDYILPITNGNEGYFTKMETKMMHRNASVTIQPETMQISTTDLSATSSGKVKNWDVNVPKTIVGASVSGDTLFVMGSKDSRIDFQQGLLQVTKTTSGWSEPSKLKIKGFKPTSWTYGMYVHPTGDVLLISQKTIIPDNFEIYASLKLDSETYGKPIKLETISSEGNDITPYLSMDKKRLYFSSNGHNKGTDSAQVENYDLFVSQVLNADFTSLSTPEKLPLHVNMDNSYEAYISEIDSNNIIFSSNRNGTGMRLYSAKITRGVNEPTPIIEEVIEPIQVVEIEEPEVVVDLTQLVISEMDLGKDPEHRGQDTKPIKIVYSGNQLNFETDEAKASPQAIVVIKNQFPYSEKNNAKTTQITITGYTDSSGPADHNQALSERRAATMKSILVDMGWPPNKIKAIGKGEEDPIASNETIEGKTQNRRVEIEVK